MATHEMRLHSVPFEMIKNGTKTVEIRLNDEKRQEMKAGDNILFSLRDNPEEHFQAEITALNLFTTLKDAYLAYPPEAYGAKSANEYEDMYKYYSKDEEEKYGVVGITLNKK